LYKALNVAKPDKVLVQLGPEHLLANFNQRPEYHHAGEWIFDEKAYTNQLER